MISGRHPRASSPRSKRQHHGVGPSQTNRETVPACSFRGQSNQGHGLSASLHRLVADETQQPVTEELLGDVESAILAESSAHGLDKNLSPGELLMILQHHQAPTRLVDVSLKPLEALYFAVERGDARDGRLFVFVNGQRSVRLGESADLPWASFVRPGGQAASVWTQSVRLVDERPLDPRMIAQEGRFLVGGVQRAYANLNIWFRKNQLRVVERQKISMLCIGFFGQPMSYMPNTNWPALGWTIRIPRAWKAELRARLKLVNISHESMYPDLSTIEWRSQRAARDLLSTTP